MRKEFLTCSLICKAKICHKSNSPIDWAKYVSTTLLTIWTHIGSKETTCGCSWLPIRLSISWDPSSAWTTRMSITFWKDYMTIAYWSDFICTFYCTMCWSDSIWVSSKSAHLSIPILRIISEALALWVRMCGLLSFFIFHVHLLMLL